MSSSGSSLTKFVSEKELDEKRQQRQKEWEKVRQPDQPLECPEEVVDNRSLFDKLQEQKKKKEDEYEEEQRNRNSVKGLEEDEVSFLDYISKQQERLQKEREKEQANVMEEMSAAALTKLKENKPEEKKFSRAQVGATKTKSQAQLLLGAVKRKGSPEKTNVEISEKKQTEPSEEIPKKVFKSNIAQVRYILPSIGIYSNASSDSETSSSEDSDLDAPCMMTSSLHTEHELKRMTRDRVQL
ncbi:PSME3-interacting protein isoform X2 [Octopus sinensis]|nr:PSME3-interacting protein isoform X2 [Octopus sinensis]XP_029634170.1 PSME3-interacting protein isoform X2 [Octopus sinensis]XP_036357253.1 PSME3-interacting protein isoform X2 [Octopus sinensis]XP_036357254.1 PSME3-interacting protein isoform X2 [Octopus sinensis]